MKVLLLWSDISGYAAACWRELVKLAPTEGIELKVIAWQSNAAGSQAAFDPSLVADLPVTQIPRDQLHDLPALLSHATEFKPDILYLPGWMHEPYVAIAKHASMAAAKKIMGADTPWRGTLRQRLARLRIGSYLDQLSAVIVPGERAFQFMRHLKIPEQKIYRGMYGIDFAALSAANQARSARPASEWPRRFLFAGRYHADKGIDTLLAGYRQYRKSVAEPWPLTCCGMGPLADQINACEGVTNLGFVDPRNGPDTMRDHGVFVLASKYDPWPLVIVEACAAGLPIIHSEACGSAVELVRPYYNGIGTATGNAPALAAAMRWMHDHHDRLHVMGGRGPSLAGAYSASMWARRWVAMFQDVMNR